MFCDDFPSTKEDAWPLWLMRRFPMASTGRMFAERGGSPLNDWPITKPRVTVKWLCDSCNNGWMSQLENQAKPVIESILDEKISEFDDAAQVTLGVWAVKTAMVLEAFHPERPWFYSRAERHGLRTAKSLPARTEVWLAKCVNQSDIYSAGVDHRIGEGDHGGCGYAVTMAFGSLAFQVVTIRTPASVPAHVRVTYEVSEGPGDQVLVQVWPTSMEKRVWPPTMGLNREMGLNALTEQLSYAAK
jgi:hypothetical protein